MKKIFLFLILLSCFACTTAYAQQERFNLKSLNCETATAGITTATTTLVLDGTASKSIVIYKVYLQNVGSEATTVEFQEEDGAKFYQVKLTENMPAVFGVVNKVKKFAVDKGLNIITDATGDIRWTVCYGLEK